MSYITLRGGFLIALLVLLAGSATAQTSNRPYGMRFVPAGPGQFSYLTRVSDALGINITTTPDPSTCRHYQGMVRAEGADGTPFFMVTRSGNTPDSGNEIICDDSPGEKRNG